MYDTAVYLLENMRGFHAAAVVVGFLVYRIVRVIA